jgi:Ca2+-binding EF-hand superfamily protein
MKKTILLTLLTALALGTTALAQGRHGGGFGPHFFERLDANADGKVSRDELRTDVQRRFAEFDLDKDGKISATELQSRVATKRGEMQARMAERITKADVNADGKWTKDELSRMPAQIFTKLDKNGDGVLTRAELDAGRDALESRHGEHGDFAQHLLSKADTNSDGVIDSQEAQRLADSRFDAVDKNHDGIVERDEWAAGHQHGSKACAGHDKNAE